MKPAILFLLVFAAPPLAAHEGHDHAAAPPAPAASVAPRLEARTPLFEIVAVLDGRRLAVYVDRAASNEPVSGAQVEVEAGGERVEASEIAGGLYAAELPALAAAGDHALVFTVAAGDELDLLNGTLRVAAAAAAPAPASAAGGAPAWWWGGAAGAALVAALGIARGARRHKEGAA